MKVFHSRAVAFASVLSAVVMFGSVGNHALARKGGKGGAGGGGTGVNVNYEVIWLGTLGGANSSALSANSRGDIVGYAEDTDGNTLATRFTPSGPVDLNVEMGDLLSQRTDGPWVAWMASGINESGQITGSIRRPGGTSHPFIYDPGDVNLGRERRLDILPQLYADTTKSRGINDLGEIVGEYWGNGGGVFAYRPGDPIIDMGPLTLGNETPPLNTLGQIAFSTGRYSPDLQLGDRGTFDPFPGYLDSINGYGVVVGFYQTSTKKGRVKTIDTVYRASTADHLDVIYEGNAVGGCINDQGDVCFTAENRLVLHRDGTGLISLDAQVVGDEDAVSSWITADYVVANELLNSTSDEFSDSSYPVIVGFANLPGLGVSEAFALIPAPTP